MLRGKKENARARRRANRKIQAFYRTHVEPGATGVSLQAAAKGVLRHVGLVAPKKMALGPLRKAAMEVVANFPNVSEVGAKPHTPTHSEKTEFYASWEWQTLRMKTLKRHGRRCLCCGAKPGEFTVGGEPVRIHVDHIKPLSKHWELRLDPENVQVLCGECNKGKGAWDETDWREDAA